MLREPLRVPSSASSTPWPRPQQRSCTRAPSCSAALLVVATQITDLPHGWSPSKPPHQLELERELPRGHVLHGQTFEVVARCDRCDDVLVHVSVAETARWARVHLTWLGKTEWDTLWPVVQHTAVSWAEAGGTPRSTRKNTPPSERATSEPGACGPDVFGEARYGPRTGHGPAKGDDPREFGPRPRRGRQEPHRYRSEVAAAAKVPHGEACWTSQWGKYE